MIKYLLITSLLIWTLMSCGGSQKHDDAQNQDSTLTELEKLNIAIKENPDIDSLYYSRALYFLRHNKLDEALTDISQAINLNPERTENYILLGDIYLAKGSVENCRKALLKAFEMDPKNPDPSLKLAELNLFLEDYDKVYLYLNKAIEIDKYNAQAYFMRGYAQLEQGDTTKAIANLQEATQLDAEYFDAFITLGYVMQKLGDPIAGNYFKSAVSINDYSIEGHFAYGYWLQENGDINGAIQQFDAVLNLDNHHAEAWYNIGFIYLVFLEDFKGAVEKFNRAIASRPNFPEAYFNRGLAYEEMKQYKKAEADYRKALELRVNYDKAIEGLNRIQGKY